MNIDAYLTDTGDISVSPAGDIALTTTPYRDDIQQIYIRLMTDVGDYLLYPKLGADLQQLYGMPQSQATGNYGVQLVNGALQRENRFNGRSITVKAVPTGPQSIRLQVTETMPTQQQVSVSVQQHLSPQ